MVQGQCGRVVCTRGRNGSSSVVLTAGVWRGSDLRQNIIVVTVQRLTACRKIDLGAALLDANVKRDAAESMYIYKPTMKSKLFGDSVSDTRHLFVLISGVGIFSVEFD